MIKKLVLKIGKKKIKLSGKEARRIYEDLDLIYRNQMQQKEPYVWTEPATIPPNRGTWITTTGTSGKFYGAGSGGFTSANIDDQSSTNTVQITGTAGTGKWRP